MPPKKPATTPAKGATGVKKPAGKAAPAKTGSGAGAKAAPAKAEKKEEPKPEVKKVLVPEEIVLKEMAGVMNYAGEVGTKLKESKRWLYYIDRNGNAGTFIKYRDVNMIQATSPVEFQTEPLRKALLGSLKYGKPHVLDITDTDQGAILAVAKEKYDAMYPGCWDDLMSRKLLEEETYEKIYRPNDDSDEYKNPLDYRVADFSFIVLTNLDPASTANMGDFFPVIIN